MDEKLRRYFSEGKNPFANEENFDEALRKKAVMEGVEQPGPNDVTYTESQEDADQRMAQGLGLEEQNEQEPEPTPGPSEEDEETAIAQSPVQDRRLAQSETILSDANVDGESDDVAAEQAKAGVKSLSTPFNPDESNAPNAELNFKDAKNQQEDVSAYIRKKYGLDPNAGEEMAKDTSYGEMKGMQKRTGILEAISDFDTALGSMGDWNLIEAKKAGGGQHYKGGAMGKLAGRQRKDFDERMKYRENDLDRQKKGIGMEKDMQAHNESTFKFDTMIRDEKEMNDPNGPLMQMLTEVAGTHYGLKNLPSGLTPKKLLAVLPQMKDFIKEQKSNEFTAGQDTIKHDRAKELKQMEIDNKKAEEGAKPTKTQETLEVEETKDLAGTKGVDETLALIDGLTGSKEILKKSNTVSGGAIGMIPDFIRKRVLTDSPRVESDINAVLALPNLKAIFGGNPTEGERKVLLETLFDSAQDESEILRRVQALEKRMLTAARENDRKKAHIKQYGSLQKYQSQVPTSLSKMTQDLANEFGGQTSSQSAEGKDPRVEQFMKANNIASEEEAMRILESEGIIKPKGNLN